MPTTTIFSTVVHGRKPFNNAANSIISDVLRGPRNSWNIINKMEISLKSITEQKSLKNVNNNNNNNNNYNKTKKYTYTKNNPFLPPPHIALNGAFT